MKRLFKTLLLFNRYKKSVQKRTDFFDNSFFNAVPDKPLATRNKPHNNQLCADLSRFISAYSVVSHFLRFAWQTTLEQNGDVIREIVGDDNYLEHHSDMYCKIVGDKSKSKEKVAEELEDYELRCQHWDKPLIATTMLQFMDTLFSSRTETIRRMHRFTNSVIIIDEVQSIPVKCVYIFNLAMNFLANFMGCTIVLCTATQPTLEQCKYPIMLDKESSMTGDYKQDFVDFARTKITPLLDNKGGYSYGEAAAVCMDKYRENGNILFVVNTKDAAAKVYSEVSNLNKEESFQAKLRFLYKGIIIKHNKTEPTYTKTSLFLCEKRRFLWPGLRKEGNLFKLAGPGGLAFFHLTKKEVSKWPMKK